MERRKLESWCDGSLKCAVCISQFDGRGLAGRAGRPNSSLTWQIRPSARSSQAHIDTLGALPSAGAADEYARLFETVYPAEADRRAYPNRPKQSKLSL